VGSPSVGSSRRPQACPTFGSGSWQAIFLADTILACQPARNPEGAEPIAVTCRIPHGLPSDGVELAPFLITAYLAPTGWLAR
jgi:hypothetical protein